MTASACTRSARTTLVVAAALVVTACTNSPAPTPAPTAPTSASASASASVKPTPTTTRPTPTPVTPDGMATGPGVDDQFISLALITDRVADRGFSDGVRLWQTTVNDGGGICGRTIEIASAEPDPEAAEPFTAEQYQELGRDSLGLITLPARRDARDLNALIAADGIPALTPDGSSTDLTQGTPVVIGPTDDILAINAADQLLRSEVLKPDGVLGFYGSGPAAVNAEAGLRWWAMRTGITLEVHPAEAGVPATWGSAQAVIVLGSPADVTEAMRATPAVTVVTTLDGYDPTLFDQGWAGRLQVATATPALGSDHPGAQAVVNAFPETAGVPDEQLFTGYAVGATWGRLLTAACAANTLTRDGIAVALAEIGPASPDFLLGTSDPGLVVTDHLPATRVSAMSLADPTAAGGLAPLTWLQSAAGIDEYVPGS